MLNTTKAKVRTISEFEGGCFDQQIVHKHQDHVENPWSFHFPWHRIVTIS